MNTIAELAAAAKHLQQTAPHSQEAKDAQRAHQTAINEAARSAAAAARSAADAEQRAEDAALRAIILSPRRLPDGMKLVALTTRQAEWAGMAPSVAGGWVATQQDAPAGHRLALVPAGWSDGTPVDLETVQQMWAGGIHLADAASKIASLPTAE